MATVKMRRFEFKEFEMTEERGTSRVRIGDFKYSDMLKQILSAPGPNGQSTEEVIKSTLLYGKIKDSLAKAENFVLLDKEGYDYVIARLNLFRWALVNETVADFCKYLKELKEEDHGVTPAPSAPPPAEKEK